MAAVPGAGRGPLRPRIPGARSTVGIADRVTDRVAGRATGRVTPGVNGASTGVARPSERARALPSGWGVARRRISNTMIVAVAMLTVATAGIFQVLQTSRVAEVGYQLRALQTERESLDAEIRLLEAQVAESSNLEHLREQAESRLGMVPPVDDLSITVDTPAPEVVPLPRRYVEIPEQETPPEPTWWEEFIGSLPGFQ